MRFGHDFHRRIIPEYHRHYVDYHLLKRLAKSLIDGRKVYDELHDNLRDIESFLARRIQILTTADSELCALFGLGATSTRIPIPPHQTCPFELTLLLEAFHEFQQDWKKLHWFARVNVDAVERILDKLWRRGHAGHSSYHRIRSRWQAARTNWNDALSSGLKRLTSLIADANHGLDPRWRTPGKSLYLARAFYPRPWSGPFTDEVIAAAQSGDFNFVIEALASESSMPTVSERKLQNIASDLLRFSVMLRPEQVKAFLHLLPSPEEFLIEHEVVKWAILTMGRRQKLDSSREAIPHRQHHASIVIEPLRYILEACTRRLSEVLLAGDGFGRLPGHYAAMYDVPGEGFCEMFVPYDSDSHASAISIVPQDSDGSQHSVQAPGSQVLESTDIEGLTPLHMAVIAHHPRTVADIARNIPDEYEVRGIPYEEGELAQIVGGLIPIALMNQREGELDDVFAPLLRLWGLHAGGHAALPVAVQVGYTYATSILLEDHISRIMYHPDSEDLEVIEYASGGGGGWTPLFHACALGEYEIVKRLLDFGFSHGSTDNLGWTPKEYAVLNGHLDVAGLFESSELRDMTDGPARGPAQWITYPKLHCAEGERITIASLGTERVDNPVTEVALSYCSSEYTPGAYGDLSYALEVSAPGTTAKHRVVRLPILDDQINDPFVFPIPAAVEPRLVFKIMQLEDGQNIMVGSGTALLEGNVRQFGAGRQSLIREQTIPIFARNTMAVVGTVTFTFLVANHFAHLQTPRSIDLTRKVGEPPALIGHRGLGQNLKTHEYLQIGENTVESFVSAAKLGATFVEFDVQVTKDHEAVIFHDFSLSESGTDVPVHDLTLDQFMYASNIQSPHGNPLSVLGPAVSRDEPGRKRKRSRSVGGHFEAGAIQVRDRLKHTVDFKNKGFKPNTRGDFIQDSFATLKELLSQVPEHVAFDVEIKYPRLHEATTAGLAPVAIELNTFVDVALNAIHQHGGNRQMILSSFTPEICMLLSVKQKAYPVFFITNAGKVPMADMERRAASVKVAVRFAQRWNLAGVVFACEPILLCPRLVGYVKNRGLVCATYGTLNNVPENVKIQAEAGVDIIIADRVGLIAKSLSSIPATNAAR